MNNTCSDQSGVHCQYIPMPPFGQEHFMVGKLSMEIFGYVIHVFGVSCLPEILLGTDVNIQMNRNRRNHINSNKL